jgi:hypothetical protein
MIEWIARNWREQWLGNFAWWQSFAALLQASLALALYLVTRKYVDLTKTLTAAQVTQIKLMQQATKRELYERRLKLFLSVMEFLSNFGTYLRVEIADIQKFSRATLEAGFFSRKMSLICSTKSEDRRWTIERRVSLSSRSETRRSNKR